jgi:hypothetical protein
MGYTTTFQGQFNLDKPLTEAHAAYLKRFSETRRMKRRNVDWLHQQPDPLRIALWLGVGEEGCYYVGSEAPAGQDFNSPSVLDPNSPPADQPGLWCKWTPTEDRTGIQWNQQEKFYDYVEWLEYLIEHFLRPWGYTLNGRVRWRGEEFDDIGTLVVDDNVVSKHEWEGGL